MNEIEMKRYYKQCMEMFHTSPQALALQEKYGVEAFQDILGHLDQYYHTVAMDLISHQFRPILVQISPEKMNTFKNNLNKK